MGGSRAICTVEKLLDHSRLPFAWHDQRIVLGFA
jgi:hypothetical protein